MCQHDMFSSVVDKIPKLMVTTNDGQPNFWNKKIRLPSMQVAPRFNKKETNINM